MFAWLVMIWNCLKLPIANSTANTTLGEGVGNKTDAYSTDSAATTKSLGSLVKGCLYWLSDLRNRCATGGVDGTLNTNIAQLLGNKEDTANTTVGTTSSMMRYVKGILSLIIGGTQEYTTGSGDWTVPAGVTAVEVLVVPGGGSGGSIVSAYAGSGGGGGGEVVKVNGLKVTPGSTIAYSVGGGGAAPSAGDNAGNDGTLSSFGSVIAKPGKGGGKGSVTTGGNGGETGVTGGAGGSAGGNGAAGIGGGSLFVGKYGGGGGGCGVAGGTGGGGGMGMVSAGGTGGSSKGAGGGGSFGAGAAGPNAGNNGNAAAANTGGGGSGCQGNNTGAFAGGAGGSGYIFIRWGFGI
jgi:hypothetical protein